MIPQYSFPEQPVPDTPMAAGYRNSLRALPQHMAFNWMRWLRNRRELRNLDNDQLRDVGLSREMVENACRLNLLRQ